jgi:ribose transport system permease protein
MKKVLGMAVLWLVLCGVTTAINPAFIGAENLQNLTRQIAMLAILAIGEGIVILSGGIDLSVGSVVAFTGLVVMEGTTLGYSPWLVSIVAIAFCACIGLLHGFLTSKLNLQPFIVTLSTMLFFRGVSRGLVNDAALGMQEGHPEFRALVEGKLLGVPTPLIVMAVLALICAFYLHMTRYGVYHFAIGRNEQAAGYSGVNVKSVKTMSYVICSVMCGIGGILYAIYSNSVQPASAGQAYELYAIAAAVVGGCSMRGGEGTVIGMIIGAAIMKTLTNAIILLNISSVWELAVIGVVILAGVLADTVFKARKARIVKAPAQAASPPPG